MESRNHYEGFPSETIASIQNKARQVARQLGGEWVTANDIEQELVLDLSQRLEKYDAEKSALTTFAHRVVLNKVASLLEFHKAQKRQETRHLRLVPEDPDTPTPRVVAEDRLDAEGYHAFWSGRRLPADEQESLVADLLAVEAELTDAQRDICRLLRELSVSEVASQLGRSRQAVYREIANIRSAFEKSGLEEYLR